MAATNDTPLSPSLLSPGQRSPLNFNVTCLDDLLIWADLWVDYNEPLYAEACRWAHQFTRWPRSYRADKSHNYQYRWGVSGWGSFEPEPNVDRYVVPATTTNFPSTVSSDYGRGYASITLAFLDLFNHMVANPAAFLEQLGKSP